MSKAFSRFKLNVDVAVWPGLMLLGLKGGAEIEKSVPVFSNTLIEFELAWLRSGPAIITKRVLRAFGSGCAE